MGNAGRNGGEYYTPRPLIRAIIKVVKPKIGNTIYDGAVGSAGFHCEGYDYLKKTNPKRTTAQDRILQEKTFYGKEKKSLAYVIAIMNMILHGIELNQEKLGPLLKLKYNNAIADAVADLGRPEEIGQVFAGFQQYLYQSADLI